MVTKHPDSLFSTYNGPEEVIIVSGTQTTHSHSPRYPDFRVEPTHAMNMHLQSEQYGPMMMCALWLCLRQICQTKHRVFLYVDSLKPFCQAIPYDRIGDLIDNIPNNDITFHQYVQRYEMGKEFVVYLKCQRAEPSQVLMLLGRIPEVFIKFASRLYKETK